MRARPCATIAAMVLLIAGLAAGCGGDDDTTGTAGTTPITVYAAASLTDVFPQVVPDAEYNFAASDTLATQIREGAPAAVYAAANERLPKELFAESLVAQPVVFATNTLVLLVQKGNPKGITGVADLNKGGTTFLMADAGVPVGDYTRTVLKNLGQIGLVAKAASQEDDVRGVTGKVALGEADAGFVYATDAKAVGEDVEAVAIPANSQPPIRYAVAVVAKSANTAAAEAFIAKLQSPEGRKALQDAGFGVP